MIFVCRLPFAENYISASSQDSQKKHIEFTNFSGEKKIQLTANSPIYQTEKEIENLLNLEIKFPIFKTNLSFPNHEDYLKEIEKAKQIVTENKIPKLVISRPIKKEIPDINLWASFKNICDTYQNTLCYLLITENEIWMGATPEILGKFNKNTEEFFTMSLAGTLPINEQWSNKEIEEQKPVSDYILEKLKSFSGTVNYTETYSHISGNIKHLRTDFTTKISLDRLENLITELHPTPAVCGIPKDICKQKILEIENYNRELYTGYIKIETPEEIYFFVNLRCAKIYNDHVVAFAGGGITIQSHLEKEWQETELKSQAILNHLAK